MEHTHERDTLAARYCGKGGIAERCGQIAHDHLRSRRRRVHGVACGHKNYSNPCLGRWRGSKQAGGGYVEATSRRMKSERGGEG
eukprot:scaffold451_cov124-Isochrysis_galbana.AAC.2